MPTKNNRHEQAVELRRRAEEIFREKAVESPENHEAHLSDEERRTLHELRVHQIELEMQNEDLRRAQAELDAARERYFDLYDLAPVGYCTLSEQGLILEANLTAANLLGTARDAMVKLPVNRFILKQDRDSFYLHCKQLFEAGEPRACELRMMKMDGTEFWAHLATTVAQDTDGAPVCRVVISDITERRQAEEALLKANERLEIKVAERTDHLSKAMEASRKREEEFQAIADYTYDWESWYAPDGSLLWVNPAVEKFTGYSRKEWLSRPHLLAQVLLEEDQALVLSLHEKGLKEELSGNDIPFRVRHKDGSFRWAAISYQPIYAANGDFLGLRTSVRDITESKQVEKERERLILELQDALDKVKTLRGLLPICSSCKKIRDDKGYWTQLEVYFSDHSDTQFSHGLCPECAEKMMKEVEKMKL